MGKETGWPITDQLLELNDQLNQLQAEEPSISDILTHPLTTDIEFLLESVISQMKTATQTYTKELREARKDKNIVINEKLSLLNEIIDTDDESITNEVTLLNNELDILKDELLQEQAMIFKNYHLLTDCKIMPAFINLEKRKAGYCNIVRLQIGTTTDNTPVYTSNPPEIRAGVSSFYKGV